MARFICYNITYRLGVGEKASILGMRGIVTLQCSDIALQNDVRRGQTVEEIVHGMLERKLEDRYDDNFELMLFDYDHRQDRVMVGVEAFTIGETHRRCYSQAEGGCWINDFKPERVFYVSTKRAERLKRLLCQVMDARNVGRYPLSSVLSDGLCEVQYGEVSRTPWPTYQ